MAVSSMWDACEGDKLNLTYLIFPDREGCIIDKEKESLLKENTVQDREGDILKLQESKNIATLKLDELMGNLTAYKLRRQTMKMYASKKERRLALRITEDADLQKDEMSMITKDFKKCLMRGKGPSRSGNYSKPRVPEKQTNEGCYKCGNTDHHIRNCPQWEIEWKKERAERRNRKKEQVHPNKDKGLTKAMVATWGESSDKDSEDEDGDEQVLMCIGESDEESDVQVKRSNQIWYMYSGCSKHMTGNKNQFLSLEDLKGGNVSFGNEKKGEIIGVGKVGKIYSDSIENVYLMDGLKCSVITVSQLCDRGKRVNNIYIVDMSTLSKNELTCLSVLDNGPLLWHKRLEHASLSQLNKFFSKDLVIGLPNIKFKEDKVCEACARAKQVRSSFKFKKVVAPPE
ncbi:uncharacterized protein [Nicotiana sylvestris]|uniref:uncharacterized protein n=1 Tax=Nicotiana sylvestris TaxID=4096 RepID=UPI00388C7C0F